MNPEFPDSSDALPRVHSILKPEGNLFVAVPNAQSLETLLFRQHAYWEAPRHLYHFSVPTLKVMLVTRGFQPEKTCFFSHQYNVGAFQGALLEWLGQIGQRRTYGNNTRLETTNELLLREVSSRNFRRVCRDLVTRLCKPTARITGFTRFGSVIEIFARKMFERGSLD